MIQSSLEHGRIAIKLFHCRVLRGAVLLNKMFKKIHRSLDCSVLETERSLRVSKIIRFFGRKTKVIITEFSKAHSFLAVEMSNNSNFWDDRRILI